jgi:S1-C subfamily serine protease
MKNAIFGKKFLVWMLTFSFLICLGTTSLSAKARDVSFEEMLAGDLKELGLFQGISDDNFDLNRAPTRIEALVMLVRILGKEDEALKTTEKHPFVDVPSWADKYVAYAYHNGLSNGISETEFGTGSATADMYLTFVLRSLGYSDKNHVDFTWNAPDALATKVGILPQGVNSYQFYRADVVLVSYSALQAKIKNSDETLAQKLIRAGVFSSETYQTSYHPDVLNAVNAKKTVLSAEEIYARCAASVFYIELFDASGKTFATGSGFFISSDGRAVTNYHVLSGAQSAKITVSDTGKQYNITGVYAYSPIEDWAIIKVDGNGFTPLTLGSSSTVVGGAPAYAIGSPIGLQNTISEGIISNPARELDGINYIQISTPISHGSSGGALINKYGEVIGITTAGAEDAQNLNFALPISYIPGENTSVLQNFAECCQAATASIHLSVSQTSVVIGAGKSQTLSVTWTGGSDDDVIHCESSNDSVADADFGEWTSDSTCELFVQGIAAGTAELKVYLDQTHVCKISVTVTDNQNNPYTILKNQIKQKGDYDSNHGLYVLSCRPDNESYFQIIYAPGKENELVFMSDIICCGSQINTIVFPYEGAYAYYDVKLYSPETLAYDMLNKKTFSSGSLLEPDYYEGSEGGREDFNKACTLCVYSTLVYADIIMIENDLPVSIGDLGFESLYQELNQD